MTRTIPLKRAFLPSALHRYVKSRAPARSKFFLLAYKAFHITFKYSLFLTLFVCAHLPILRLGDQSTTCWPEERNGKWFVSLTCGKKSRSSTKYYLLFPCFDFCAGQRAAAPSHVVTGAYLDVLSPLHPSSASSPPLRFTELCNRSY